MRRFLNAPLVLGVALLVGFVAISPLLLCGCVAVRAEDGTMTMEISKFADEREVDAVREYAEGVDAALTKEREERAAADVAIRTDIVASQTAANEAYAQAIAEGKTSLEAQAAANAAAISDATARAAAADAAAKAAAEAAERERVARENTTDDTLFGLRLGKVGLEWILGIFGVGTAGAIGLNNRRRNKSRASAINPIAAKVGVPVVPAS